MLLRKLELYILILLTGLCAVFSSSIVLDRTLSPRNLVWGILTLILFVLITCRAFRQDLDFSIIKRAIFTLYAGYSLFTILSVFPAINKSESVYEICRVLTSIIFLFIAAAILSDRNNRDTFIKCCMITAPVMIIYGIISQNFYFDGEKIYRLLPYIDLDGAGTHSNRNLCTSAAVLMLPFCIYSFRYSRFWKILSSISILSILFVVAISRTRSALLAFVVFVIILSSVKWKYLVVAIVLLTLSAGAMIYTRGSEITKFDTIKIRQYMWTKSLLMSKDYPLGVGAGNWKIRIPEYNTKNDWPVGQRFWSDIYYPRPENDYLWVLTETGVLGLLFYLSTFAISIYYLLKLKSFEARIFIAGICAYMTDAFFCFPKERPFHCVMLLVFMAIALGMYHKRTVSTVKTCNLYLASIVCLGILAFSIFDFYQRFQTEGYHKRIMYLKMQDSPDWLGALYETENYSWFASLDPVVVPMKYYKAEAEYQLGYIPLAFMDFQKAYEMNPNNVIIITNLGSCWSLLGRQDKAFSYYEKTLKICPDYEGAIKNINLILEGNINGTR